MTDARTSLTPTGRLRKVQRHLIDGHTRLAYIEALEDECEVSRVSFYRRVPAFFAAHGIEIDQVVTDNVRNYRSVDFTAAVVALGEGASPDPRVHAKHNGKIARYNRLMVDEVLYSRLYTSETQWRQAMAVWVDHDNCHRPHTSRGEAAPASLAPARVETSGPPTPSRSLSDCTYRVRESRNERYENLTPCLLSRRLRERYSSRNPSVRICDGVSVASFQRETAWTQTTRGWSPRRGSRSALPKGEKRPEPLVHFVESYGEYSHIDEFNHRNTPLQGLKTSPVTEKASLILVKHEKSVYMISFTSSRENRLLKFKATPIAEYNEMPIAEVTPLGYNSIKTIINDATRRATSVGAEVESDLKWIADYVHDKVDDHMASMTASLATCYQALRKSVWSEVMNGPVNSTRSTQDGLQQLLQLSETVSSMLGDATMRLGVNHASTVQLAEIERRIDRSFSSLSAVAMYLLQQQEAIRADEDRASHENARKAENRLAALVAAFGATSVFFGFFGMNTIPDEIVFGDASISLKNLVVTLVILAFSVFIAYLLYCTYKGGQDEELKAAQWSDSFRKGIQR